MADVFQAFFNYKFSYVHNCEDRFYIPVSSTAVRIYEFNMFTAII